MTPDSPSRPSSLAGPPTAPLRAAGCRPEGRVSSPLAHLGMVPAVHDGGRAEVVVRAAQGPPARCGHRGPCYHDTSNPDLPSHRGLELCLPAGTSGADERELTLKVSIIWFGYLPHGVPDLGEGLVGCLRCGNVWRLRRAPIRICPRCKSPSWNLPVRRPRRKGEVPRGQGIEEVIGPRRSALKALARKYGGSDLRVFGSVARGEAGVDSDVDLLVRFARPIGLLRRAELKERAETLLRRSVDFATEANLHWFIRARVLDEAVAL